MITSGDIDAQFRHRLGIDGETTTVNAKEERVTCFVKVETIVLCHLLAIELFFERYFDNTRVMNE